MIDRDGMLKPHGRCAPSPLVGEGWGGAWRDEASLLPHGTTLTPNPSPQGGGEQTEQVATEAP
jgi:hypothetical protein